MMNVKSHYMTKNYVLNHIYNDENECINDTLSSCQPVGCQATPRTLGDMEYVRTHLWNLLVIDYHVCIILHLH